MKEETERHKLLVKRTVISLAAAIRVAAAGEKPRKKKILHGGPAGVLQAISCLNIIEVCMYSSGACWYFLWAKKNLYFILLFFFFLTSTSFITENVQLT